MIIFPHCKINLGLHILRKREDGYHDLETVFYPLAVRDALEILKNDQPDFTVTGLPIDGDASGNLCLKAYELLKNDFPALPPVSIHLHKAIPMGAGLGGGSSDGAAALMLLNDKFRLNIDQSQLISYALQLGSDCPFFIKKTPCFAKGRGEIMEEIALDLSQYTIVLVHPAIHINTAWAFSNIIPRSQRTNLPKQSLREAIQQPISSWKNELFNDFEPPVFDLYPEIKAIRDQMYAKGALYSAMTGSGSTVFGLFERLPADLEFPSSYMTITA